MHKLALSLALALAALPAAALDDFTITDGDWGFSLGGLTDGRLGGSAGGYSLGNSLAASPGQMWLWYRADGDTREYALSNQTSATVSGNLAQLEYFEPLAGGSESLRFALQYSLQDLGGGSAQILAGFAVINPGVSTVHVDLFAYHDANLLGTAGDDSATVGGLEREVHDITDPTGNGLMSWRASERGIVASEVGAAPGIVGRLSDGSVSTLANVGDPFGPGDYSGGFQWSVDIDPGDAVFVGATTTTIYAVPEPGSLGVLAVAALVLLRRCR